VKGLVDRRWEEYGIPLLEPAQNGSPRRRIPTSVSRAKRRD
jgi:hypothetical protein